MCCAPPPDDQPKLRARAPKKDSPLAILGAVAFALAVVALIVLTQGCAPAPEPAPQPTKAPVATSTPQPSPTPVAQLSMQSRPAGASVTVDGRSQGVTPLVVEELAPGEHRVSLSLDKHEPWQQDVALAAGEKKDLSITLQAIPEPTPIPYIDTSEPIYPVAVMVENHPDARPQSGLVKADIVYEALAEGGISRFMAVFVKGEADAIGPVRSARHYFAYLAAEYNATYIHIGASPQGYAALTAVGIPTLDETYGDPGFWRSQYRYAPHNAYTSSELIKSAMDRGAAGRITPGGLAGFTFRDGKTPVQGEAAEEVSLIYPARYQVEYVYSPEDKAYKRYMQGLPHRDAQTDEHVTAQNVIVQYVDAWLIPGDDKGRLDMEQVGEGDALYFRDGVVTKGFWKKPSYGNHTEWYDLDWNPVQMNPGKVWVQMIPPAGTVTY